MLFVGLNVTFTATLRAGAPHPTGINMRVTERLDNRERRPASRARSAHTSRMADTFGDASYLRSLRRNCRQRTEQDLRCLALKQPRKETQWIVEAFDEKLSDCRISLRGMQDRLGMRVGGQKHAV